MSEAQEDSRGLLKDGDGDGSREPDNESSSDSPDENDHQEESQPVVRGRTLNMQLQAEIVTLDNVIDLLQSLHKSAGDILTKIPEMCMGSIHVKNTIDLMKDLMKRFSDLRDSFEKLKSLFVHQARDTHLDARRLDEIQRLLDYKRRYMEQLGTARESFAKTVDLVRLAVDTASMDLTENLRFRASLLSEAHPSSVPGDSSDVVALLRSRARTSGSEAAPSSSAVVAPDMEDTASESGADEEEESTASGSSGGNGVPQLRRQLQDGPEDAVVGEQLWNMMQRLLEMNVAESEQADSSGELGETRGRVQRLQVLDEDKDLDEQVIQELELQRQGAPGNSRSSCASLRRLPADGGSRQNALMPSSTELASNEATTSHLREQLARKLQEKEEAERQIEALRRTRDELIARAHGRIVGSSAETSQAMSSEVTAQRVSPPPAAQPPQSIQKSPSGLTELRSRVVQLEAMRANLLQSMAQLEALESAATSSPAGEETTRSETSPMRLQRLEGDGGVFGGASGASPQTANAGSSTAPTQDTFLQLMESLNGTRGALNDTGDSTTASSVRSNDNNDYSQETLLLLQERDRILEELKDIRQKRFLLQKMEASAVNGVLSEGEVLDESFTLLANHHNNQQQQTSRSNRGAAFFTPSSSGNVKPLNNMGGGGSSTSSTTPMTETTCGFFPQKLSPQLLQCRHHTVVPTATVINGYGDGGSQAGNSATTTTVSATTNGGRDSVTFQEPVAKFIPNEELYENMRQARMQREEERSRQGVRNNGAGWSGGGRGGRSSNRWRGCYSDNTTQATWGGSSSGGAIMSQLDEELTDELPTNGGGGGRVASSRDLDFGRGRHGGGPGGGRQEGSCSTNSRSISPVMLSSGANGGRRWGPPEMNHTTTQGVTTGNPNENSYEKRIRELEEQVQRKDALCHELMSQLAQQVPLTSQSTLLNMSQRSSSTNISHSPVVPGNVANVSTVAPTNSTALIGPLQSAHSLQSLDTTNYPAAMQQMASLCSMQTRFLLLQNQFQQLQQQMNMMSMSAAAVGSYPSTNFFTTPTFPLPSPMLAWPQTQLMPPTGWAPPFMGMPLASAVNGSVPPQQQPSSSQVSTPMSAPPAMPAFHRGTWFQRPPGAE